MKKVLIIGEFNPLIGSLNQHLAGKFQTQICLDTIDMVKGMVKVFKLDMAIICLKGVGELDDQIWDFFDKMNSPVPVLFVGTAEECNYYQKICPDGKFDFVVRPTTLGYLQRKCEELLKLADAETGEGADTLDLTALKKKRILAVDDSGILLRSVKTMLEKKYDVAVANSGKLALKQAQKKAPDLILLDYEMPEWDGRKTVEEIRNDENLKDTPVVFLTAVADKAHIAAVLELKPSGYLLKPIEQQVLMDTIEKAMIRI